MPTKKRTATKKVAEGAEKSARRRKEVKPPETPQPRLEPDSNPRYVPPAFNQAPVIASQLTPRCHEWWWTGYVPREQLTLFVGDSDGGKSTVLAAVAAAVSAGRTMIGKGGHPPGKVLLYSAEEDPSATVIPRLRAANAECHRVHLGDYGHGGVPLPRLTLPADLHKLGQRIHDLQISMLIIDPITSYLGGDLDPNKDQGVRDLLFGLQTLCVETACTIILSKHYRKSRDGDHLSWIGGAAAWAQVPRVILAFGRDPDDQAQRVMTVSKNSLMPGVKAERFKIVDRDGAGAWVGLESCDLTTEDVGASGLAPADRDALGDAQAFLLDQLEKEERPAKDLVRIAQESGIALGTLRRAKTKLLITSHPIGPNGQRFIVWRMPEQKPPG